jgi:heat shock protein HslJ
MDHRRARLTVGLSLFAVALVGCASSGPTASSPPASAPASLPGTSWMVATIDGTATLANTRPTIAFGADGQVQGTGGCNGYRGPYTLDGNAIEVGDIASTLILCEGEVGAQEAAFMAALRGATTWRIAGDGDLELTGIGAIVGTPVAGGSSESPDAGGIVGSWELAEMGPTADFADLQPTIEFAADGSVSGFAACNTFSGTYTTDGATLTLGPLGSTRIGCPRPASAVEGAYLEALSGVSAWAIEPDGRLLLDGAVPLRYTPH